jgi:hypothetical protein
MDLRNAKSCTESDTFFKHNAIVSRHNSCNKNVELVARFFKNL